MIEFIMVNPKQNITEEYLSKKMSEFFREYNYKIIHNNEELGFLVNSKIKLPLSQSKEDALENQIEVIVDAEIKSYEKVKQLEIKITCTNEAEAFKGIEKLKFNLKDEFLEDWHDCIWLSDTQSSHLSEKLYLKIHKLENLFREIVNRIMISNFGHDWWVNLTSYKIRSKYIERGKDFSAQVSSFKGVNDKLLAVEVDDLIAIMKHKVKKVKPENFNEFIDVYESLSIKGSIDEVIKKYKNLGNLVANRLYTEVDLSKMIFLEYFDVDFERRWKSLRIGRNHIAHNKLLDSAGAKKIYADIENIEKYLMDLKEKLESEPSREQIQYEYDMENYYDYEKLQKSIIEAEAGITIYNENEIIEQFVDLVNPFINTLTDEFYFRQDLEISIEEINDFVQSLEIIRIEREWEDKILTVSADMEIDEEQISTMTLTIYINEEEELMKRIDFQNGQAYYDGDKGYYLPLAYENLDESSFNEFKYELTEIIGIEFTDYVSELNYEQGKAYKEGGSEVLADFSCEECGNETVSLNDDIFQYGKCATCGHEHTNIKNCLRCECIYNGNWEGTIDLCDNCYERYMEE